MMSEKRFKAVDGGFKHIIEDKEQRRVHLMHIYEHNQKVVDLLNEQQATIQFLQNEIDELKKDIDIYKYEEKKHSETARKLYEENEWLRKQIQNYEKLLSNSYVGEEETLDGFVGKYVIWEDELQKYKVIK